MKKSICVLCSLLFVAACASVTSSNLNNARRSFANDNFLESASNFANNKDIANQDSLELLITGLSQFQAKNYDQSDKAFEEFNKRNINTIGGSTLREAKGLLLGKLSTEYKPCSQIILLAPFFIASSINLCPSPFASFKATNISPFFTFLESTLYFIKKHFLIYLMIRKCKC